MSRNFELLHQMGKIQEMLQPQAQPAPAAVASLDGFTVAAPPVGAPALEIDPKTREELGKLVQRLFLVPGSAAPRQIVFAGAESGDGCTWICSRVGEILASQVSGSVCLVDCNLRTPTMHHHFQVDNHYGLTDALLGGGPIRQYAQPLSRSNLWLVSCGSDNEKSQEFLTSDRMRLRISELRSQFDYVLMDVASLNVSNHAMIFGGLLDGLVMVLKANSTRRDATRDLKQQLQASNVNLLGAVLNQRTFPIPEKLYNKL